MISGRELRGRIKSIKSTRQITKAMQMVSASKMRRAELAAKETLPYSDGMFEIVSKLGTITEFAHPLLTNRKIIRNIAFVVIASNRGFVGNLTSNLTHATSKHLEELKKTYPNAHFWGISIHKLGLKVVQATSMHSKYHFAEHFDPVTTTMLTPIYKVISDGFISGEWDAVYLCYTKFIHTMKQEPIVKKILPIQIEEFTHEPEKEETVRKNLNSDFVFEPDARSILNFLLPEYFEMQILSAILQSNASEHSTRMIVMKNATDNAEDLLKDLVLEYNRARQSAITSELTEISAGLLQQT
jgi:F-type H+-transporting ATPase subunit gamma